jgi:AbrB family looped-hinge helix DNA binding protein
VPEVSRVVQSQRFSPFPGLSLQVGKVGRRKYKDIPTILPSRDRLVKERILGTAKISTKAQVTIPVEVRKKFKLEIGELLVFVEEDGKLLIKKP